MDGDAADDVSGEEERLVGGSAVGVRIGSSEANGSASSNSASTHRVSLLVAILFGVFIGLAAANLFSALKREAQSLPASQTGSSECRSSTDSRASELQLDDAQTINGSSLATADSGPNRSKCAADEIRHVLITGIGGLIGSHVAHFLARQHPCRVVYGLVRPRSDLSSLIGILNRLKLVEGDISDAYRMISVVGEIKPHEIYHFAAQAINGISSAEPEMTTIVNVQGTLHLLEAIRVNQLTQHTKFLLAGSSTEYGRTADVWNGDALPETAPFEPVTPYGVSKVAAEHLCRQYWLSHGVQIVVARFFIQIGPYGTDSLAIQQFARQIAMAERGLAPPVVRHGNLGTSRDITDAATTAPFVVAIMIRGVVGEAYNVGSGIPTSMQHLLDIAVAQARVKITTAVDPTRFRAYDEKALLADNTKLRRLTGWRPAFEADITVRRILHFWRQKIARLYDSNAVAVDTAARNALADAAQVTVALPHTSDPKPAAAPNSEAVLPRAIESPRAASEDFLHLTFID